VGGSTGITVKDLMWAAGFLEGEGCFYLNKRQRLHGLVNASQVHPWPLERLQRLFGGRIYSKPSRRPNQRSCFEWRLVSRGARALCMTLYPLLSPHRQVQIRRILVAWKAAPGAGSANLAKTHCPKGHPYEGHNLVVRHNHRHCRACSVLRVRLARKKQGAGGSVERGETL
jgi:hypothetical protein